ncbi:Fic family protein [[Ruminococcus] torques]|uniref:Fic family protein n=2 Tax=Bacillota TaxID=1239 RepID=UPI0027BACC3F|nr:MULTISPECIES: hypothetical protein [Clostridia]
MKNVNYIMCGASAHDTAHDATHDTSVISKQNLLLEFCADPKSRDEMQAYIDVSSRSHFSKYYLKPLLSSGKLEMLFPDKPLFGTIYFPTAPLSLFYKTFLIEKIELILF